MNNCLDLGCFSTQSYLLCMAQHGKGLCVTSTSVSDCRLEPLNLRRNSSCCKAQTAGHPNFVTAVKHPKISSATSRVPNVPTKRFKNATQQGNSETPRPTPSPHCEQKHPCHCWGPAGLSVVIYAWLWPATVEPVESVASEGKRRTRRASSTKSSFPWKSPIKVSTLRSDCLSKVTSKLKSPSCILDSRKGSKTMEPEVQVFLNGDQDQKVYSGFNIQTYFGIDLHQTFA